MLSTFKHTIFHKETLKVNLFYVSMLLSYVYTVFLHLNNIMALFVYIVWYEMVLQRTYVFAHYIHSFKVKVDDFQTVGWIINYSLSQGCWSVPYNGTVLS